MYLQALTAASEGTRTLVTVSEWSADVNNLAITETFLRAHSLHALPSAVMPPIGQNAEQTLLSEFILCTVSNGRHSFVITNV